MYLFWLWMSYREYEFIKRDMERENLGVAYVPNKLVTLDVSQFDTPSSVNEVALKNVYRKLVTLDVSQFDNPSPVNEVAPQNVSSKLVTLDVSQFDTPSPVNEVSARTAHFTGSKINVIVPT